MTPSFYYVCLIVLCTCSTFEASDVYYHIKPSMNASCPEEPCLTLSQFATHTEDYLESNTTLYFLPGQHNLSLEINVTTITKLSMTSRPTISNSPSATIACEGNASFTFSNIEEVYIGHMRFSGCYGHKSISVQMFELENSLFFNHTESALEFISSMARIVRSSFIANSNGSYQQVLNRFRKNNFWRKENYINVYAGAALALSRSNVVISGCVFKQNHAEFGGAIFGKQHSKITIIDTMFEQNYALCTYTRHMCVGGVLYCANGTVEVYNSTFYNNTLMNDYDRYVIRYGGVFVLLNSTLKAVHSVFEQNRARWFSRDSYGGVIHAYNSTVNVSKSEFTSNSIGTYGGVMSISNSVCFIDKSKFVRNSVLRVEDKSIIGRGGVLYIENGKIAIICSVFEENRANLGGGVMWAEKDSNFITIINSSFSRNSAEVGGVMRISSKGINIVIITGCEFNKNYANESGGVIDAFGSCLTQRLCYNITINNTKFIRNKARTAGGVLGLVSIIILLQKCEFVENSAYFGGIVDATGTNLTIVGGMIERNSVNAGVIYATSSSSLNLYDTTIKDNTANRGIICLFQSIGYFSNVTLADNTGSVFIAFGNLTFIGGVITNCSISLNTNKTLTLGLSKTNPDRPSIANYQEGGALTLFKSTIAFKGKCYLTRNHAKIGGAIHATESKIYVYDNTTIAHNRASKSGGGVYIDQSVLNCEIDACHIEIINNTCGTKGGGIHAISSTISTQDRGVIIFQENCAENAGGGACLELNSKLYVLVINGYCIFNKMNINFQYINNSANYGGAVYIADETNFGTCASESYQIQSTTTECFIQPLSVGTYVIYTKSSILVKFINNAGSISGSDIFGGLLDRCTISSFAEKSIVPDILDGITYLKILSNINNVDSITSNPVRVCFCNTNRQSDCSYQPPPVQTEKGRLFTVTLVAVDQVNNTIPNVTIRSSLSSSSGGLGENQLNQSTGESCSDLRFEIFSPYESEQLILYADGPCKDAPMSQRRVEIKFTPCTCPLGFQVNVAEKTKCDCECNSDLLPYVTKCDPKTETIVRETNFWMDYIGGYLVYPHCPLDYCKPSEDEVKINLNVENGVDIQCANHRTGLLCGTCLSNYSLSLGSSQCIQCPSNWPAFTVILILASTVAGVLFVALLLLLNLTVAVGTLNGIIFYANVVAANSNAVFPSNMFISWLNLEVGFNICFFKGMDAYWKTWLQLAFPTYLIFLVVMVIIISKRSARFTRLIGRRDPVATLATLVLLSYTKLLYAIIASLSGTVLKYPELNHTREEVVWLPDASIKYLSGKHIPLFIVAVLILLAGIFYTTILFLWQWILQLKMFRWLSKTQKLSLFIQTYHVPYVPQHRYWTGLLLVARIILYIVSSANVEGDPKINLTAIGVVVISTIILKDFLEYRGRIYHRKSIEMLETACHFNLVILCIATFLILEHEKVSAVIFHVSVSFTAALLLAVLLYHVFTEVIFKTKMWKNYKERQHRPIVTDDALANRQNTKIRSPTYSIVEIPKQSSQDISNKKEFENIMSEFDGELKVILLDGNEQYH